MKKAVEGRRIWVEEGKLADFEENEKRIAQLLAKLQAMNAEKQVKELSLEEKASFESTQMEYIEAKEKRIKLSDGFELNETVVLKRKS